MPFTATGKEDVGIQIQAHAGLLAFFRRAQRLPGLLFEGTRKLIIALEFGDTFVAVDFDRIDRSRTQANTAVCFRLDDNLRLNGQARLLQDATRNSDLPFLPIFRVCIALLCRNSGKPLLIKVIASAVVD